MLSPEEFDQEVNVPPVFLYTADYCLGCVFEFDPRIARRPKLEITVRDENVNQVLQPRWRMSVNSDGIDMKSPPICPEVTITPSDKPTRAAFPILLDASNISAGLCNTLEVVVSSSFIREDCATEPELWKVPSDEDDIARATFSIWDMSDDPGTNSLAAQSLLNSCPTKPLQPITGAP